MSKPGRKIKLTPEVEKAFLQAIALGCPIKDACGCAGIGNSTFHRWMEWADSGRRDAKRFRDFRDRIKEAAGNATKRWLAVIEKAAMGGTWQAAAWKLERRRDMVARQKHEVDATVDASVSIEKTRSKMKRLLSDPAAASALGVLGAALDGGDDDVDGG